MKVNEEFVTAVRELAATEIVTVDGKEYSTRALHDPRSEDPVATPLAINTLLGFCAFLKRNIDGLAASDLVVHVENHGSVRVLSKLAGHFRQREMFATAKIEALFPTAFSFGAYYESETFIVALLTLFVESPHREDVLRIVGNIKEESVKTVADDGVSQVVIGRAGIVQAQEVIVPKIVYLRPYRTFREVEQPESTFLLRMRAGKEGGKPTCALFECDGGQWKLEAIAGIREYLETHLAGTGIAVIA